VDAGSREENALKPESGATIRFHRIVAPEKSRTIAQKALWLNRRAGVLSLATKARSVAMVRDAAFGGSSP
jgi:hypothetical protein